MNNDGSLLAKTLQCLGHRIQQVFGGDAKHLTIGSQRVHKGAQQIEHRAHAQTAAKWSQVHQCWMPCRRKEEGHSGLRESIHHLSRRCLQMQAEPFEHIR